MDIVYPQSHFNDVVALIAVRFDFVADVTFVHGVNARQWVEKSTQFPYEPLPKQIRPFCR
jgi:hypothetical protein